MLSSAQQLQPVDFVVRFLQRTGRSGLEYLTVAQIAISLAGTYRNALILYLVTKNAPLRTLAPEVEPRREN